MSEKPPKKRKSADEPAQGGEVRQPRYGEYLDYGNGVRIRSVPSLADDGYPENADYISYDDFPAFHPDDIAAIRRRLGINPQEDGLGGPAP